MEMLTVREFCAENKVFGWYASDIRLLSENGDAKILAHAIVNARPSGALGEEYWVEDPRLVMFVFRSPRKARGIINGKEVEAKKVLAAIHEMKVSKGMTDEATKLMLLGEL